LRARFRVAIAFSANLANVEVGKEVPNHEEHCQHTIKTLGVRGDDIHTWMDEPSRPFGSDHREFRHDSETVKLVGRIFAHRYGRKIAEEIALDHITLDHKEAIERRGYESSSLYATKQAAEMGDK